MPEDTKEPQSYGSQADWSTGKTGEQVNDPKATPPPQHSDFYDERRESENTHEAQGGLVSDFQLAENAQAEGRPETLDEQPIAKVTTSDSGAKRDSFFKRRDYE